jgi:hypothetical protein
MTEREMQLKVTLQSIGVLLQRLGGVTRITEAELQEVGSYNVRYEVEGDTLLLTVAPKKVAL